MSGAEPLPATGYPATRFFGIRRPVALTVLVATVLLVALLIPLALSYQEPPPAHAGDGDLALYGHIVARLHAGENYYPVAHQELIAGHYGTLSTPSWRTPLYAWLVSRFPSVEAAQIALMALAFAAAAMVLVLFWRNGNRALAISAVPVLLLSLGGTFVPGTVLFSEYTAGMLILLSAAAFGLEQRRLGYASGALALFIRELAAPYVVICLFLAWREKRWGEATAWLIALIAYAGYFYWHHTMVQAQLTPSDFAYPGSWVMFGGPGFVLSTAAFNGLFTGMQMWLSAIVLPLGVLGLLAWPGKADVRIVLTVLGYLAAFAIVGKPLNRYWGAMYTPLLTLGLPWAVLAVVDLWRSATMPGAPVMPTQIKPPRDPILTATRTVRGAPASR